MSISFILLCLRYIPTLQDIINESSSAEECIDKVKQLYRQNLSEKFIDVTPSIE